MPMPSTPATRKAQLRAFAQERKRNHAETHLLAIKSRVPSKWRFVDLETGDVWMKTDEKDGFRKVGLGDFLLELDLLAAEVFADPTAARIMPAWPKTPRQKKRPR